METTRGTETLKEEFYLNLTGKLLLASIGAWLVGKVVNTKIRGNSEEIRAVANALMASKRFQEELRRPGATVESVAEKLRLKQMTAVEFERILGVRWPL
jgi:uncharacterized protein YacL (UPF0231 family)